MFTRSLKELVEMKAAGLLGKSERRRLRGCRNAVWKSLSLQAMRNIGCRPVKFSSSAIAAGAQFHIAAVLSCKCGAELITFAS
jgi:hypothetical protein